jgi:hypothetical protein
LAVSAQASGAVDYRHADSNSLKWLLHESLILDEIERHGISRVIDARMRIYTGGMSVENPSGPVHRFYKDAAEEELKTLRNLLFPYYAAESDSKTAAKKTMDATRKRWVELFGDPADPKVAAELTQLVDKMRKGKRR